MGQGGAVLVHCCSTFGGAAAPPLQLALGFWALGGGAGGKQAHALLPCRPWLCRCGPLAAWPLQPARPTAAPGLLWHQKCSTLAKKAASFVAAGAAAKPPGFWLLVPPATPTAIWQWGCSPDAAPGAWAQRCTFCCTFWVVNIVSVARRTAPLINSANTIDPS